MANLLTDPPLLIDVPSQSTAQAKQSGMALAQNFLSGYWRAKEDAVQQSRWLAGQAMRDAQLTQVQMQNQAAQEAADLKAKQAAALGGFYSITKKAAEQGWGPDTEAEMYDYIERNPSIANLPEVGKIREEFRIARDNRLEIAKERKRNEIELKKAELQNAAKSSQPKIGGVQVIAGKPFMRTFGGAMQAIKLPESQQQLRAVEFATLKSKLEGAKGTSQKAALSKEAADLTAKWDKIESDYQRDIIEKARSEGYLESDSTSKTTGTDVTEEYRSMIESQSPDLSGNVPPDQSGPVWKKLPSGVTFRTR